MLKSKDRKTCSNYIYSFFVRSRASDHSSRFEQTNSIERCHFPPSVCCFFALLVDKKKSTHNVIFTVFPDRNSSKRTADEWASRQKIISTEKHGYLAQQIFVLAKLAFAEQRNILRKTCVGNRIFLRCCSFVLRLIQSERQNVPTHTHRETHSHSIRIDAKVKSREETSLNEWIERKSSTDQMSTRWNWTWE